MLQQIEGNKTSSFSTDLLDLNVKLEKKVSFTLAKTVKPYSLTIAPF
jgi:hypothetical protein